MKLVKPGLRALSTLSCATTVDGLADNGRYPQDHGYCFCHFPRLRIHRAVSVHGGRLTPFTYDLFKRCDSDWAIESYFARAPRTVWTCDSDGSPTVDAITHLADVIRPRALLVYNALLTVTGGNYPDPRLSATYQLSDKMRLRLFGPFDRTYLLNDEQMPELQPETLNKICELCARWSNAGFDYDDRVFSPLRGLANLAAAPTHVAAVALPLLVSLEGFLLPRKVQGIANEMTRRLDRLLGSKAPPDLHGDIKIFYAWRSDLLHGRPAKIEVYAGLEAKLRQLTATIVEAATDWLAREGRSGNDISALQRSLEP